MVPLPVNQIRRFIPLLQLAPSLEERYKENAKSMLSGGYSSLLRRIDDGSEGA